jgi:hypothetical protein
VTRITLSPVLCAWTRASSVALTDHINATAIGSTTSRRRITHLRGNEVYARVMKML